MPCNDDDADRETHSVIYERRQGPEDRVRRLNRDFAFAQQPRSGLTRVVANVQVEDTGALVRARSDFNLTAFRRNDMETFPAATFISSAQGRRFQDDLEAAYRADDNGYVGWLILRM